MSKNDLAVGKINKEKEKVEAVGVAVTETEDLADIKVEEVSTAPKVVAAEVAEVKIEEEAKVLQKAAKKAREAVHVKYSYLNRQIEKNSSFGNTKVENKIVKLIEPLIKVMKNLKDLEEASELQKLNVVAMLNNVKENIQDFVEVA